MGNATSRLVQDFSHQRYESCSFKWRTISVGVLNFETSCKWEDKPSEELSSPFERLCLGYSFHYLVLWLLHSAHQLQAPIRMNSIEFLSSKAIKPHCHPISRRFPEYIAIWVEVAVRSNSPQTREDDGRSAMWGMCSYKDTPCWPWPMSFC